MPRNLPPSGSLITFLKVPAGSYASDHEVYRITYPAEITPRSDVHLWNETADCGTYDRAWSYDRAEWQVVA